MNIEPHKEAIIAREKNFPYKCLLQQKNIKNSRNPIRDFKDEMKKQRN